jgi:hypothetical protein
MTEIIAEAQNQREIIRAQETQIFTQRIIFRLRIPRTKTVLSEKITTSAKFRKNLPTYKSAKNPS